MNREIDEQISAARERLQRAGTAMTAESRAAHAYTADVHIRLAGLLHDRERAAVEDERRAQITPEDERRRRRNDWERDHPPAALRHTRPGGFVRPDSDVTPNGDPHP